MSAPLVPPDGSGLRRPAPSIWRLAGAAMDPVPIIAIVLVVATVCCAVNVLIRRMPTWDEVVGFAVLVGSGVGLFWWRVSSLRRAFTRGREIHGRVTHFKHFTGATGGFPPRVQNFLQVVYPAEGGERVVQYVLADHEAARVPTSIGAEVVLIVHPELSEPMLRDIYLGP